mmetsp:Transcript_124100/g.356396  ORF Transcript_124100/g.356396 Transcript_124100/m.356396 type:complete len:221 (-) Transcript_124100:65-727(-)
MRSSYGPPLPLHRQLHRHEEPWAFRVDVSLCLHRGPLLVCNLPLCGGVQQAGAHDHATDSAAADPRASHDWHDEHHGELDHACVCLCRLRHGRAIGRHDHCAHSRHLPRGPGAASCLSRKDHARGNVSDAGVCADWALRFLPPRRRLLRLRLATESPRLARPGLALALALSFARRPGGAAHRGRTAAERLRRGGAHGAHRGGPARRSENPGAKQRGVGHP